LAGLALKIPAPPADQWDVTDVLVWRISVGAFLLCVGFLVGLLIVWLPYLLGSGVSVYDLGSPQLRAFA
jgi:hypothetical protein